MELKTLYWNDVNEGDDIPSVSMDLTRDRVVMIVCGTRDIFPLHYDADFARASGYRAPTVPIAFLQGLIGRCLTDWTGPAGRIRGIRLILKTPGYQGDTINVGGKVIRKYVENRENKVDCELIVTKQDGTRAVDGQATVLLPVRE